MRMKTITKVADAKRWIDELLADRPGWSRLDDDEESFWVYEPGASDVCANGDPWISVICLTCAMGVEPAEARRHRGHPPRRPDLGRGARRGGGNRPADLRRIPRGPRVLRPGRGVAARAPPGLTVRGLMDQLLPGTDRQDRLACSSSGREHRGLPRPHGHAEDRGSCPAGHPGAGRYGQAG